MENQHIIKSSLDQPSPQKSQAIIDNNDMWQRLMDRYNLKSVFKTDLCTDIKLGRLSELNSLMFERRQVGIDRYGTVLQAFNGRNVIEDLIAEQLDSLAYSEQASLEYPELTEEMLKWQKNTINSIQKLIDFQKREM